jgi:hypothetical protein
MAPLTRLEPKQLQHLSLEVDFDQPHLLLQLAQLPALTHLALQYNDHDNGDSGAAAAATASAWPLLPQLRELVVDHGSSSPPTVWLCKSSSSTLTENMQRHPIPASSSSSSSNYQIKP